MSFGGGSSGGQQTTTQSVQPYAAAQPALNQIISEAGQLYNCLLYTSDAADE